MRLATLAALALAPLAARAGEPQTRTLDVVRVGFTDAPVDDSAEAQQALYDFFFAPNPTSVAGRYLEMSYGKLVFVGEAHVVNLAIAKPALNDYGAARSPLCQQYPSYCDAQHFVMISSFINAPIAEVGGRNVWMGGTGAAVHELGHNLGLMHANSYICYPELHYYPDTYDNCSGWEYGDPYSVMGTGSGHMHAREKGELGWFEPSNLAGGGEGVFTIAPLELPTLEVQAVSYQGLTFEYRRVLPPSSGVSEGVLVHSSQGLLNVTGTSNRTSASYSYHPPIMVAGSLVHDPTLNGKNFWAKVLELFPEAAVLQLHLGSEPPLELSAASVSDVTTHTATVTWTSAVLATSQVEHGPTLALGQATAADGALTTEHVVLLSGLAADTEYFVRAKSTTPDNAGYSYARFSTPPIPDSDGDGLDDELEADLGTDATSPDTDGDGLKDPLEVSAENQTNPRDADTDGDGLLDGEEDADQSGAVDAGETDPANPDSDGDGLKDGATLSGHGSSDPASPSARRDGGPRGCAAGAPSWLGAVTAWLACASLRRRRPR